MAGKMKRTKTFTARLDLYLDEIRTAIDSIPPTEVERGAGISRSTLFYFVQNKNNVSVKVLRKMSEYLDADAALGPRASQRKREGATARASP